MKNPSINTIIYLPEWLANLPAGEYALCDLSEQLNIPHSTLNYAVAKLKLTSKINKNRKKYIRWEGSKAFLLRALENFSYEKTVPL